MADKISNGVGNKFIGLLIVAVVLGGGIWYFGRSGEVEAPKQSLTPYSSTEYKVSFSYPSGLYLKEIPNVGTPENPQLAVVLVENTQVNRDILDGKSIEGGEGPTAITAQAYPNPDGLSAQAWAEQDASWAMNVKDLTPVVIGGQDGISFDWDGLYRGRSVILAKGTLAYVFSVTWITPEDQLIKDFDMVLDSTTFSD